MQFKPVGPDAEAQRKIEIESIPQPPWQAKTTGSDRGARED